MSCNQITCYVIRYAMTGDYMNQVEFFSYGLWQWNIKDMTKFRVGLEKVRFFLFVFVLFSWWLNGVLSQSGNPSHGFWSLVPVFCSVSHSHLFVMYSLSHLELCFVGNGLHRIKAQLCRVSLLYYMRIVSHFVWLKMSWLTSICPQVLISYWLTVSALPLL